jgi:MFS family permease
MTVFTLLFGSLTDAIGLRRTFFVGVWVCVIARTVMVFATVKWVAILGGLIPLSIGEALGTPVLVAAMRRYSNTRQRSMSFSVFYAVMNLGFLASFYIFDYVRSHVGENGHLTLPLIHTTVTSYRTLFFVSLCIEFVMLPFIYFLRPGAEATDEGLKITPVEPKYPNAGFLASFWLTVRDSTRETIHLFTGLLKQSGFYKLIAFLMLIAFLKLIFMVMDYVYPTFGIRELGKGAPVGKVSAINNYLIIFLAPVVGALTQRFAAYRMVIVGGIISAASVFFMVMPPAWFEPMANSSFVGWLASWYLGLKGAVHPYYVMSFFFILVLSVGEAFYSPRVYEYAAAIAPKGREASYGALSYVPFLLAKMFVGTVTGTLLAKYCPADGVRHPEILWLVIALSATLAPVGLILLRRFIYVHEAGRKE